MNSLHHDSDKPVDLSLCDKIVQELASDRPLEALATLALYVGHRKIPSLIDHQPSSVDHNPPHVTPDDISSLELLQGKALKKLFLYGDHQRRTTNITAAFAFLSPLPQNCKRKRSCLKESDHHQPTAASAGPVPSTSTSRRWKVLKEEDPDFIPKEIAEDQKTKKRKRKDNCTIKKTKKKKRPENVPTQDLPDVYRRKIYRIGGGDIKFVIEKTLYHTDVNSGESRLSMPTSQVKNHDFLTTEETYRLVNDKTADVAVTMLDMNLELNPGIKLKRWNMLKKRTGKGNPIFALTTKWNDLVESNQLTLMVNKTIQVWSFRVNDHLHLAIVLLNDQQGHAVAVAAA